MTNRHSGDALRSGILRSMAATAAAGARALGEEPCRALAERCLASQAPDGGFAGRGNASDLYYTGFALDCLAAVGRPPDVVRAARHLAQFGSGSGLTLIHLASLVRARRQLGALGRAQWDADEPARALSAFRCADGGYDTAAGSAAGSPYGAFLYLMVVEAVGLPAEEPCRLGAGILGCRSADGGFGNSRGMREGTTPATAAALCALAFLGEPVPPDAGEWLASRQVDGGFAANPSIPFGDLLSTATSLFALRAAGRAPLDPGGCRDFVSGLRADGGFFATAFDDATDCEYTFYGLLATGCLAGM